MSQMYADQSGQAAPEGHLPRASILEMLGVADSGGWIRCSARFAALPSLLAQLPLVFSTVLMYVQPALLSVLAVLMN